MTSGPEMAMQAIIQEHKHSKRRVFYHFPGSPSNEEQIQQINWCTNLPSCWQTAPSAGDPPLDQRQSYSRK